MIPNGGGCRYFGVKKLPALLRGITSNMLVIFSFLTVFIDVEQKANLNITKKRVKIKIFLVL